MSFYGKYMTRGVLRMLNAFGYLRLGTMQLIFVAKSRIVKFTWGRHQFSLSSFFLKKIN